VVDIYLLPVLFMFFDKLTVKPIYLVRICFLTGVSSESASPELSGDCLAPTSMVGGHSRCSGNYCSALSVRMPKC